MPECEPSAIKPPVICSPKSIKQKEQIDLYQALFDIHKKAQEIDTLVSAVAAKLVIDERNQSK
jgi:hypothetical protein